MSYYPTFAFFTKPPSIIDIARGLVIDLDPSWVVTFELENPTGTSEVVFRQPQETLGFLDRPTGTITRFWMSNPIHSMSGTLTMEGYLDIEFWDFDDEIFDEAGVPNEEQKQGKYRIALTLHRSLVQRCGALLSYTSGSDNKYAGPIDHYDQAAAIANGLQTHDSDKLLEVLSNIELPWVWMLALNRTSAVTTGLASQLQQGAQEVQRDDGLLILEKTNFRPFFLR
jgi:hypothetical protein